MFVRLHYRGLLLAAILLLSHHSTTATPIPEPGPEPGFFSDLASNVSGFFSKGSGSYTPTKAVCPVGGSNQLVRAASTGVSPAEAAYISSAKKTRTTAALHKFLTNAGVQGDFKKYSPTLGIAFSGGGYRAMLSGAGVLDALDSRTEMAVVGRNPFAGLLQASDYITGLSGGAWLVGNAAVSGFAPVGTLKQSWGLQNHLVAPGSLAETFTFLSAVKKEMDGKQKAGFDVTITDFWSLLLKSHLVPKAATTAATTWSAVADTAAWKDRSMPYPIIVSEGRKRGEIVMPTTANATVYETSPLEFGSWNKEIAAFYPTRWLGSGFNAGGNGNTCWNGFDSSAFVMGTSSSLFNSFILRLENASIPSNAGFAETLGFRAARKLLVGILESVAEHEEDIAEYPNPFAAKPPFLSLVDGGTSNQNIPLLPLLRPERKVDFILAHDAGAFPHGSSLVATASAARSANPPLPFPAVPPSSYTFANNPNLTHKPTFFGCDAKTNVNTTTTTAAGGGPVIAYLPNAPWSWWTNSSTFQLRYHSSEVDGFLNNGHQLMTQGNKDPEWPACLGCAVLLRAKQRAGDAVGSQCEKCFAKYCWDGKVDERKPAASSEKGWVGGRLDGSPETWVQQDKKVRAAKGEGSNLVVRIMEKLLDSPELAGVIGKRDVMSGENF